MHAVDSVEISDSVNQESVLPSEEPAVTCTAEIEMSIDRDDVTVVAESLVEIPEKPLVDESSGISAVAEEMPRLERKDAADSIAVSIPVESRSPSPPTLQHKDVVDTLTELDQSEGNSPLPNFCHQDSEEEMEEVDVDGGKLASGNDVFLGNSLGSSSACESGRSSTIAVLRQRAGECEEMDLADGESEKASELCNSRDFADSNDDMLRNGFSGSELSIHSGSPTILTDVDSDDSPTMMTELFDATAAECNTSVVESSNPAALAADNTDQSCDVDKPPEIERSPSTELQVSTNSSDTGDLTHTETNGSSPALVAESESCGFLQSHAENVAEPVPSTTVNGFDEDSMAGMSKEPQQTVVSEAAMTPQSQGVCENSAATSVLEKLLNESSQVPSPAVRDSQFHPAVYRAELNSPSAGLNTAVGAISSVPTDSRLSRPSHQLSTDRQQFLVCSPPDVSHASSVAQYGFVASPIASSAATQIAQFTPSFMNVGSPSLAGNIPRGSCPTPGMENVGSPYSGGYRRLSSGSGSHVQQHLLSPEMNTADQRLQSPAGYGADYQSTKQGSYAMRPLHDNSYQSAGGPHSVKSSPGAAVGSPGSGCAVISPNGNYARAQSFGSLTHSPAMRVDQSPASAGSGGFGGSSSGLPVQQGSFNRPNPSPLGSGGAGSGSVLPNKSPVGSTNVFSPAPAAAMSPSVVVTSATGPLSTPLQHSNIAAFSCSPPDAGLPFHFATNVAVPVSATTYASPSSPTPHSLQLLSPSNNNSRVSAGYQTASTTTNPLRRHPAQQLGSSAVGLPYYGMLPSPPASMSYTAMVDNRFSGAPMDHLMSTFSAGGPPSGRQTAPISRAMPSDCSLVQLQQLTNRLSDQSVQPPLDMSYGISASQPVGFLPLKSDTFGRAVGMPGTAVNQACKQSGRRRAAATDKATAVGPPSPLLPHATHYNMLGMFPSQHQAAPHVAPALEYQRYFANADFFGQGTSQLPMQMMPFGPRASRSSTPFTLQPSSQSQGSNQMYSSYNYGRVPSDAFTDLPRR